MKTLHIFRGLPGSGKTTAAKELASSLDDATIYSTDKYWDLYHKSEFIACKTRKAHQWNQDKVKKAMLSCKQNIIVDNTNLDWSEISPYQTYARVYGYQTKIYEPQTSWWISKDIELLSEKNTHGVPIEKLVKMLARYEPLESIQNTLEKFQN